MTIAYIGLGSNLDEPDRQLSSAISSLQGLSASRLVTRSSYYRSEPLGPAGQPDYINAAVKLETTLTAHELLGEMQEIELLHGRQRSGVRWGPRTLDLDLLLYGDEQIDTVTLRVPHPEIANRNFVLQPLYEISAELYIPGVGSVRELLSRLGDQGLERLTGNG